jgi:hypothetical protein
MKKIRKGDVVVIHSHIGIEDRFGWLGVVDYNRAYGYGKAVGVQISNETQGFICEYPADALEVIDHIDETPEPRAGDVVVFINPQTIYCGEIGLLVEKTSFNAWHIRTGISSFPLKGNPPYSEGMHWYSSEFEVIDHIGPATNETTEPKIITVEPLDLPGDANSYLLAIDFSASMIEENICSFIANHFKELQYKVAETVTFNTGIIHEYAGMPDTCDLHFNAMGSGTNIECVLSHALLTGRRNILFFSDGNFSPVRTLRNLYIVKTPDGKAERLNAGELEGPVTHRTGKSVRTTLSEEEEFLDTMPDFCSECQLNGECGAEDIGTEGTSSRPKFKEGDKVIYLRSYKNIEARVETVSPYWNRCGAVYSLKFNPKEPDKDDVLFNSNGYVSMVMEHELRAPSARVPSSPTRTGGTPMTLNGKDVMAFIDGTKVVVTCRNCDHTIKVVDLKED